MNLSQPKDIVQISSDEAAFMTLHIDASTCSIQIRWLRPVDCEECVRGVQVASRVAEALQKLRHKQYTLMQE